MIKIILTAGILISTSFCFGQFNFGIYAGWQNSSSHQKIIRDELPFHINYIHLRPDMGFVGGISISHPLGRFFAISNETGYSQVNLRSGGGALETGMQERFAMHFATTEIRASIKPLATQQTVLRNSSAFVGGGIKIRMDKNDHSPIGITPNGNPLWPYLKTGLALEFGRLSVSPHIHIPLAPFYKSRDIQDFHFNLYLRTWGVNLGYRLGL